MRKDILEEKAKRLEELRTQDARFVAYRGSSKGGGQQLCIMKVAGGRILWIETQKEGSLLPGDIYMGRVEKCNANIGASFVDIGKGELLFLPGVFKAGSELPVLIKNPAYREKLARASEKLPETVRSEVEKKAEHACKGARLFAAEDLLERSVREAQSCEGARWITEDEGLYKRALEKAQETDKIFLHRDESISLCELYGLRTKLAHIFDSRVMLRSGAELVFAETEAMCVIDVNTAKALKGKEREDTFLEVNLEAAEEVALQIEARNLSGIILVDFINMKDKKSETILLEEMRRILKSIGSATKAEDITKLGIMELVRPRKRDSIRSAKDFINSTILTQ